MSWPLPYVCTLALVACFAACGDAGPAEPDGCSPRSLGPGSALVLTSTYETSSLDTFAPGCAEAPHTNRAVLSGDTALRRRGSGAVVVSRGIDDNLVLLDERVRVLAQPLLDGCGPHDALALPDGRLLVTCYEDVTLRLVDADGAAVVSGASLASYADGDGLPEMDQAVLLGDKVYVSVQRLDRAASYSPTGAGSVVEIDLGTLAPLRELGLPCTNPFTRILVTSAGKLVVGCAGDFLHPGAAAIAQVDPVTGESSALAVEAALGGAPTALALGPGDEIFALISVPDPVQAFVTREMRLVRLDAGGPTVLRSRLGFVLAGLAVTAQGDVLFGDRSTGASAGVWLLRADGALTGPVRTGLPPLEIEVY